jgi:hypothetical protein
VLDVVLDRAREPEQALGRLEEDRHLVAVVLIGLVQAMDGRSHRGAERAPLDELSDRGAIHSRTIATVAAGVP